MTVGVCYTFPLDVYPRYSYLQSWTGRLFKRFKEKIELGKLHECVSNGYADLQELSSEEDGLQLPVVTVFAKNPRMVASLGKDLVVTLDPFRHEKLDAKPLTWTDYVSEGKFSKDYDSKILVVIAEETDMEILGKVSELSHAQQHNAFIYNPRTKSHRLYKTTVGRLPTKDVHPKVLSHDIQSVLELKVITILEKMANYMEPLVPRACLEPEKSLLDDVKDSLKHLEAVCLKEVIKASTYTATDNQGRFPEIVEKKRRRRKKKKNFPKNGKSKSRIIDTRKFPHDKLFSKTLNNDEINSFIALIQRRSRCQMIHHLSMKFGIHPMVTTTFFTSDKFFKFDERFDKCMTDNKIRQLDMAEMILSKCETSLSHVVHDVDDYIKEKYEYLDLIQRQQFELYGLLRQTHYDVKVKVDPKLSPELQEELLILPEVTGCGTIYGYLTLHASSELSPSSKDLVKQLLQRYNYHQGYKVTVVSPKMEQANSSKAFCNVENGDGLKAEVLKPTNSSSNSNYKVGTLGCFVEVNIRQESNTEKVQNAPKKSKESDSNEEKKKTVTVDTKQQSVTVLEHVEKDIADKKHSSKQNQAANLVDWSITKELYCITCRHCVSNCKDEISCSVGNGQFAVQSKYFIEGGDRFDIALLNISEERKPECVLELKYMHHSKDKKDALPHVSYYPWNILEDSTNLARRSVYKFGNITKDTYGVVASSDYMEKPSIAATKKRHTDPSCALDRTVNVLIIGSDKDVFSKDGDSGSIICDKEINTNNVVAISILHGALVKVDTDEWECSYSALLKQTFDELERRFKEIDIQIPDFTMEMYPDDPFGLIANILGISLQGDAGEQMDISEDTSTDNQENKTGALEEQLNTQGEMIDEQLGAHRLEMERGEERDTLELMQEGAVRRANESTDKSIRGKLYYRDSGLGISVENGDEWREEMLEKHQQSHHRQCKTVKETLQH